MILSAQTIRAYATGKLGKPMLTPFEERTKENGMTYGLSACGYDLRLKEDVYLLPDCFMLASARTFFQMPNHIMGVVHDKSTLARRGLSVFNTVIEPGWYGYLTLELSNRGTEIINLTAGSPIAQVVFQFLDQETEQPYRGKYSGQPSRPVPAILE